MSFKSINSVPSLLAPVTDCETLRGAKIQNTKQSDTKEKVNELDSCCDRKFSHVLVCISHIRSLLFRFRVTLFDLRSLLQPCALMILQNFIHMKHL